MAEKLRPTLADYIVIALSPALIMGLVGSLIFFLLEVFYRGSFGSNLRWILFFYVFGAVLAARISLTAEIASRGALYGGILGLLTWLSSLRFAGMTDESSAAAPAINLFLVLLTWWCTNKLVRDCTHIDEGTEIDAAGLLEASGLEDHEQKSIRPTDAPVSKKKSWIARWFEYNERRKKKRTPGVWVVYFSLAALPLFGLGQAFIPPDATDRREYTFWLLVLYLGCALGLLLTTCFLGLRQYLRQRKLKMPPEMAGAWLAVGAVAIVALLAFVAILPRPEAGYSALGPKEGEEGERKANNQAFLKDGKAKDADNPQGKKDREGKPGTQRDKDAPDRDRDGGKGDKDGKKDRPSADKDDRKDAGQSKDDKEKPEQEKSGESASRPNLQPLHDLMRNVGPWMKWIVFAIIAIIVLYYLLRNGLAYLANFTEWARKLLEWWQRFWAGLFGGASASEPSETTEPAPPTRTYRSYPDPFLTGSAEEMDIRELVRYTFAALQAWGREQDIERRPDETPLEYAGRLAAKNEELATDIRKLASLYARAVYGHGELPEASEDFLREFWQTLDGAVKT